AAWIRMSRHAHTVDVELIDEDGAPDQRPQPVMGGDPLDLDGEVALVVADLDATQPEIVNVISSDAADRQPRDALLRLRDHELAYALAARTAARVQDGRAQSEHR